MEERISAFHQLGEELAAIPDETFQSLATTARNENAWFTIDSIQMAVRGVCSWLEASKLRAWSAGYNLNIPSRTVAIVMAGNIPLVGFHDFLCVLIAGHNAMVKLSSKDRTLIRFIVNTLVRIEPRFSGRITITEDQLRGFDAIIATGSDNTSRYFEYYFGRHKHIIRRNRTSVAVLSGNESGDELAALGTDVFTYYGLGCRNVGKIFIPENYALPFLLDSWSVYRDIVHHHKYCNNYDYQKSILLVTQQPFLDSGFVMLQENDRLFSPLAVVYYEFYEDQESLTRKLLSIEDKVQCVVSATGDIKFGKSQFPTLTDYADRVDTMAFVSQLEKN